MNDDSDKRLDGLFAAARSQRTDTTRLEYGFETRLLARIRDEQREVVPWYAFAWRLCPVFAGIVIALGAWNYYSPQDIDLQAVSNKASDDSQIVEFLTGTQI